MTGKKSGTYNQPHRTPLYLIGSAYDNLDYHIFKDHLRLPMPYLKVIFQKCPITLKKTVHNLPKVFEAVDNHQWEKIMAGEVSMREKLFRVAKIPPMYFADRPVVTSKPSEQASFQLLVDNVEKLKGRTFYFYSEFCDAALNAAVTIVKSAVDKRVRDSYCSSFPNILADYKADWDISTPLQQHVRENDLVVIYAVGSEYSTEFTSNLLQEILQHREVNQKTTIICSSLTPSEYTSRYSFPPSGIEVGFADQKIKKTLTALAKELA